MVSTLAAHTSPEGTCTFVPLVNGTAKPLPNDLQCPTPTNPSSALTLRDMPWGMVGVTVGGMGLGIVTLCYAAFLWTAPASTLMVIFGVSACGSRRSSGWLGRQRWHRPFLHSCTVL